MIAETKKHNFWQGKLNAKRIEAYRLLSREYKIDEGTVGYIFGEGIKFAIEQINKNKKQ